MQPCLERLTGTWIVSLQMAGADISSSVVSLSSFHKYQELAVLGGHERFHALQPGSATYSPKPISPLEDFQPLPCYHSSRCRSEGEGWASVNTDNLRQECDPRHCRSGSKTPSRLSSVSVPPIACALAFTKLDCILIELLTMRCHLNSSARFSIRAGWVLVQLLQRTDMRADSWLGKMSHLPHD